MRLGAKKASMVGAERGAKVRKEKGEGQERFGGVLYIESSTWHRDNSGLFDYQSPPQNRSSFTIKNNCDIYRHSATGRASIFQSDQEHSPSPSLQDIYIASVHYNPLTQRFRIQPADVSGVLPHHYIRQEKPDLFRNSYIAVNSAWRNGDGQGYPLGYGNFVRLGKIQFCVIEIYDPDSPNSFTPSKQTSHLEQNKGIHIVKEPVKGSCKICLTDQDTPLNPLITPCNCKGSCGVVHVQCLRCWTTKKIKKEVSNLALSYNFSKFQCEICKELLPRAVRLADSTEVVMLDYEKASKPYIVLESTNDKGEKSDRVVHVLFPSENKAVKIGRGTYCPIRIDDITVSRTHAEICYRNGVFYLKDLRSKFGTLVKFRQEVEARENLKVQSGRTVVSFSLRARSSKDPARRSHKPQRNTEQQ